MNGHYCDAQTSTGRCKNTPRLRRFGLDLCHRHSRVLDNWLVTNLHFARMQAVRKWGIELKGQE